MTDSEFDSTLIAAALRIAADEGWRCVTVAAAARAADLPLARARERFPDRGAILLKFGRMADQAVLEGDPAEGSVRDQLFDLLMRRFDALQSHRGGILALMRALPFEPGAALLLACATRRSMRWMLQTAGVPANGLFGELRVKGLVGVWLWALRAWEHDDSEDLTATMAALDTALARAEQAAGWLGGPGARAVATDGARSSVDPDAPDPGSDEG